jgi:nucleotide-binding universal stress UspA family protein
MLYKKILVAIDRSLQASSVFEQALDIAQKEESKLMLFHSINKRLQYEAIPFVGTVGDVDIYGSLHNIYRDRLQKEIEYIQDWLQHYRQQANIKKISAEVMCELGEPGKQICHAAKSWGADLIIIGRRGHRGISEILLGSVSNYVLHHAPCSVLVIQEKAVARMKMSVGEKNIV